MADHRRRVLVVEDSVEPAESLLALLRLWGYECHVCGNGSDALSVVPHFKPDVVVLDIDLPDMSGWELARLLPSGPIRIAISGHNEASDFIRSQRAGIVYHLVKPKYQEQLRELLARIKSQS